MVSTFMGLETSKRALTAAQSSIATMSQNVANANTIGYTRQRVNLATTSAFPSPSMSSSTEAGQLGTGVSADSIQRIRDSFLDTQYRKQANKVGYYGTLSESLIKMEGIMNEPTESGLQSTLESLWNSLQDLSSNTDNSGARAVVAASGQMVADTLNYYYNSLTSVKDDIGSQIEVKAGEINSILDRVNMLNKQISEIEPNGYIPNDLYDERDVLVDSLSQLVNIKVTNVKPTNYGNAKPISEGLYNIELVDSTGKSYSPPINLVSVDKTGIKGINEVAVNYDPTTGAVSGVTFGSETLSDNSYLGELAGLIESFGYTTDAGVTVKGSYPEILKKLDNMTEAFATEFNRIHKTGYVVGSSDASTDDFFTFTAGNVAQTIAVNQKILDDPTLIAAAGVPGGLSGDNENAKLLAGLKAVSFSKYGKDQAGTETKGLSGSLDSFYAGLIGELGVKSKSAQTNNSNSIILVYSVATNRQSVSSVEIDEEMTDMIKFQHAYNAAARNITMIDEMLDKIINGMGVGGR